MGQEKLRLLVVDDNPDHAVLMTDALRTGLDASVSSCASAREALKLVESGSPDAVVLDYRLPAVEGSEALLALRSRTEAPIIVVTGLLTENCGRFIFFLKKLTQINADLAQMVASSMICVYLRAICVYLR